MTLDEFLRAHRCFWGAVFLFALVAYLLVYTASDPGLTWDEAIYLGDARVYWFWFRDEYPPGFWEQMRSRYPPEVVAQLHREYRVPPGERLPPPSRLSPEALWRVWMPRPDHPPLGKLCIMLPLMKLHNLMGVIAAARMGPIFCFALTCVVLFLFVQRRFGYEAGLFTIILLVLMPRMFAHAHLASLEMPLLLMWVLTVVAFEMGVRSRFWGIMAGAFFGLALLVKFNAVFLLPILAVWGLVFHGRRAITGLLAMVLLGPLIFLLGWPAFWAFPAKALTLYLRDKLVRMPIPVYYLGVAYDSPPAPWHYPFVMTLVTTPLLTLVAAGAGVLRTWRGWGKGKGGMKAKGASGTDLSTSPKPTDARSLRATAFLFVIAFAVPLLVMALPGVPRYDGVRLFLPAFPFLACLAGLGMSWAWERAGARKKPSWLRAVLVVLLALQALPVVLLHPFQLGYYNELVGGPWGAKGFGFETTYWGDTFTMDAVTYIARRLPKGGKVALVAVGELVPTWYHLAGLWPKDIETTELKARNWDLAVVVCRQGWIAKKLDREERRILRELARERPAWMNSIAPFGQVPGCLIYERPGLAARPS